MVWNQEKKLSLEILEPLITTDIAELKKRMATLPSVKCQQQCMVKYSET